MYSVGTSDDSRAILNEQKRDADPGVCWLCHGDRYIMDPGDPENVVPCDECAAGPACDLCGAPAVTMAGETLLCATCDTVHGAQIAARFTLDMQYQPDDDLMDVPF